MTIEEIKEEYLNEWVLIKYDEIDLVSEFFSKEQEV
jgi:hypothetical protein